MIADGAVFLLFIIVAVGHALRGPARSVKVLTAVLVLGFAWRVGVRAGADEALGLLAMIITVAMFSMAVGLLLWREPAALVLTPADDSSLPAFAREDVEQSTTALRMLGLRHAGDATTTWSLAGDERLSFIRQFVDGTGTIHGSVVVLSRPRVIGRQLQSMGADGVSRSTCNLQHNAELLAEPRTLVRRVPRATSWEEMLKFHRSWAVEGAVPTQDVEARAVDIHDGWTARLVESGVAVVRNGQLAVRVVRVPWLVARVVSAWFA